MPVTCTQIGEISSDNGQSNGLLVTLTVVALVEGSANIERKAVWVYLFALQAPGRCESTQIPVNYKSQVIIYNSLLD